jgi:hypothetical protein
MNVQDDLLMNLLPFTIIHDFSSLGTRSFATG